MINFRYHLVSLIAVFLALAIGVALGATVIERAIVNGLQDRLDRVERNANATKAADSALRQQLDDASSFIAGVSDAAVQGRLTGHAVLVFAERGVDSAPVKQLVTTLQTAGADSPAIVWLEP